MFSKDLNLRDATKTVLNCLEKISPFYIKLGFVPHLTGMRYNHSKN